MKKPKQNEGWVECNKHIHDGCKVTAIKNLVIVKMHNIITLIEVSNHHNSILGHVAMLSILESEIWGGEEIHKEDTTTLRNRKTGFKMKSRENIKANNAQQHRVRDNSSDRQEIFEGNNWKHK